eukprot:4941099-Amphidinium_carterae.1
MTKAFQDGDGGADPDFVETVGGKAANHEYCSCVGNSALEDSEDSPDMCRKYFFQQRLHIVVHASQASFSRQSESPRRVPSKFAIFGRPFG